jgi:urea transporter
VLKADRVLIELGLFGFNSSLIGLALGNFFAPGMALWAWTLLLSGVTRVVAHLMIRYLPVPALAAPFIITFWVVRPMAKHIGLERRAVGPGADALVSGTCRNPSHARLRRRSVFQWSA